MVNTLSLLEQQKNAISLRTLLNVRSFHGNGLTYTTSAEEWEKSFEQCDVFVIIGKILLENLRHGLMRITSIDLLIFDECHHTSGDSDYNSIMREFYYQ